MADEEPQADQFNEIVDELVTSFPFYIGVAPYAAQLGKNEEKKVLVPTEEGEETKVFNREEWNNALRLFVQRLKLLPRIRTPPRAGRKEAPPPQVLYLGPELLNFIKNNQDKFTIIDEVLDKNGKKQEVERDPFAGNCLKTLLKSGLALQSTVANLLRAYNANQTLYENSTLNKKRAKKEEKPNKGIVGADDTMKKELAGIFDRLGKYYMETREAREKKKAAKRAKGKVQRKAAKRLPMTKTETEEGFDPNQFPFGSTLQSIIKLGRKYAPGEADAQYGPKEKLTPDQVETLQRLKENRAEDPEYVELQEEEACTKRAKVGEEAEEDEDDGEDND